MEVEDDLKENVWKAGPAWSRHGSSRGQSGHPDWMTPAQELPAECPESQPWAYSGDLNKGSMIFKLGNLMTGTRPKWGDHVMAFVAFGHQIPNAAMSRLPSVCLVAYKRCRKKDCFFFKLAPSSRTCQNVPVERVIYSPCSGSCTWMQKHLPAYLSQALQFVLEWKMSDFSAASSSAGVSSGPRLNLLHLNWWS